MFVKKLCQKFAEIIWLAKFNGKRCHQQWYVDDHFHTDSNGKTNRVHVYFRLDRCLEWLHITALPVSCLRAVYVRTELLLDIDRYPCRPHADNAGSNQNVGLRWLIRAFIGCTFYKKKAFPFFHIQQPVYRPNLSQAPASLCKQLNRRCQMWTKDFIPSLNTQYQSY